MSFLCVYLHVYMALMLFHLNLFVCVFCSFLFVCLAACLFSKEREKEAMELDGWVGWEGLEEDEREEALIRIYNMKKAYF